jgi:hypothetical protein
VSLGQESSLPHSLIKKLGFCSALKSEVCSIGARKTRQEGLLERYVTLFCEHYGKKKTLQKL